MKIFTLVLQDGKLSAGIYTNSQRNLAYVSVANPALNSWLRKSLILAASVLLGMFSVTHSFSQTAASATWAGTSNLNAVVAGNVTGATIDGGSGIGTVSANTNGASATSWTTSTSRSTTDYYEYAITPVAGYNLTVTSISLNYQTSAATWSGGSVYYSLNAFSTSSTLLSNFSPAPNTTAGSFSNAPSISVASGTTLTVRVYAWGSGSSTRAFYCKNMVISGTTIGTVYKSQFISMDLTDGGTKPALTWCAGETRDVKVTVKNNGTATWTNSSPDINIGVKWNTNGTSWTDYHVRTDAAGLTPGSTATFTLPVTASNNVNNPPAAPVGYTTPLSTGSNKLTFDVVYEGLSWFGNNSGVGPGNLVYASSTITIVSPTVGGTVSGSATKCSGSNTGSVTVAGHTGTVAKWQSSTDNFASNIVDISNTTTSLTYTNLTATTSYRAVITNGTCSSNSSAATITITPLPSITAQPASLVRCPGTSATFSVTAAGTPTYQWRKGGTNIVGATASSYTITSVVAGDAANYDVVVTASSCSSTSAIASLTVNTAASISVQPASQTICLGNSVTFSVTAAGTPTFTYQWKKDGGEIDGATSSAYSIPTVVPGDAASYTVVVANACNTATSSAAVLTINTPPSISVQPAAQTICSGSPVTFSVTAAGTSPTYQWRKGGVAIGGATSSSYSILTVAPGDAANYDVVVSVSNCSSLTSSTAALTVNTAPSISVQPASQTICVGNPVTFSVTASGTPTPVYQWKKDGGNIAGATSSSYSIPTVATGDAASYTVVVTNTCNTATSSAAVLTLNTPPTISVDPVSQTKCAGTSVTFSVTAAGTSPTYQWRKGGSPISGATGASYTILSVVTTDAANYDVVVSVANCSSVTSALATLTVNTAPAITTQPATQATCVGNSVSFTVAASGTPTPTYQWRKGGADISGATSATYTIASPVSGDAATYSAVATNTCNSATSNNAILTVNTPPTISVDPVSQTKCAGSSVTFSVTAAGTSPSYQWRKGGSPISGATGASYTILSVVTTDAANYDVVVSVASCSSVTSALATLTVNTAPAITTQPATQATCVGNSVSFTVGASGTPTPTYQWRKGSVDISGATSATYTIASPVSGDAATYSAVATNICNSATSNNAILTVNTPPTISVDPVSQTKCAGTSVTFSVTAAGTSPTYQWRKGGSNIVGATSASYSILSVVTTDAANYDVVVSVASCSSVTSALATLTVNTAPAITTQPATQATCVGNSVSFTVGASGTPTPTYQWRKGSVDISGATSATYTIASPVSGDAGTYSAVATNSCNSATSNNATLTVNTPPTISVNPVSQTKCAGSSVTFSVTAAGTSPTYQWRKGGSPISGATGTSYSISSVATTDAANYDVVVSVANCSSVTSAAATLTVNTAPAITTQPSSQARCVGSSVSFTVAASGTPTPTYQWRKGSVDISGATSATYTIASPVSGDAGTYSAVATNSCNSATSNNATLTVNTPPTISVNPVSQTKCAGSSVTFSVTAAGTSPTYQWRKGGANISGATGTSYSISSVATTDAANYDVVVSVANCSSVTSSAAALTVNVRPTGVITGTQTICNGQAATLSISVTGTGTWNGTLSGGQSFSGSSNPISVPLSPAPTSTTTYTITTLSDANCTSIAGDLTGSAIVSVNPLPSSVAASPSSVSICSGTGTGLTGSGSIISQSAIHTDNFNGTPTYAATGSTTGNRSQIWGKETSGSSINSAATFTSPNGGSLMVALAAAGATLGTATSSASTILTSPAINTNGYSALTFTFNHSYKQGNSGSGNAGTVEVSINGGAWTVVKTYTTNQASSTDFDADNVTLSNTYLNQSNFKIRFNFISANSSGFLQSNASWWAVDDVMLNGVPLPLYSWTATTGAGINGLPAGAGTPAVANAAITVAPTASTNYTLTVTDPVTGCSSAASPIAVTVSPVSVGGTISGSTTVCAGTNSGTLTLGSNIGGITKWQSSTSSNFSSNVIDIVNTTNTQTFSNLGTTTYYRAVITSGVCASANSSTATVTVVAATVGGSVAGNTTLCSGTNSGTLTLSDYSGPISKWQSATASDFSVGLTNISNTTATLSYTDLATTTYYRAVISNGVCSSFSSTGTITVNASPVAYTVTGGGSYCSGDPGVVVGISNSQTGVAYELKRNGNDMGFSLTGTGAALDFGNQTLAGTYTVEAINLTSFCRSVMSGTATVIVNENSWTGNANSNWNDDGNWSCGSIPLAGTDVIIPSGRSNYPSLSSGTILVHNLFINGGELTVNNTLKVSGSISNNNGTLTASGGTIELNGTTMQTISGSMFTDKSVKNLKISNHSVNISAVANDTLNIIDSLYFGNINNAILNTGNNLVFKSTEFLTAKLADITNGGANFSNAITGKATVQRYIPSRRGWRMMTAPIADTTSIFYSWQNGGIYEVGKGTFVTGPNAGGPTGNGLDISNGNSSMKTYDTLSGNYKPVINTYDSLSDNTNPLGAKNTGYFIFVRGDRNPANNSQYESNITTLSCKGNLQTGDQVFKAAASSANNRRYTLIGNPYTSPINLASVERTNLVNRFYAWDANLNLLGGYVVIDENVNGGYSIDVLGTGVNHQDTSIIQSGQAFFVEGDVNTGVQSLLTIKETSKAGENQRNGVFRPLGGSNPSFRTSLYLLNADNSTLLADGTLAKFNDNYSKEVTIEDAWKFGNTNEMLGLLRSTKLLAVEKRPVITGSDTLFLNLTKTTQRDYQFVFTATDMDNSGLAAFLEDSYLGTTTPLSLGTPTKLNFNLNGDGASRASNRFRVVFAGSGALPVTYSSVKAWQQNHDIAVEWKVENELNIKQYEIEKSVDGRSFTKVNTTIAKGRTGTAITYNWLDAKPVTGDNYYRIRSINTNGKMELSKVVKVRTGKGASVVSIYPNPVTDGVVGLQLTNMPAGHYGVRILNVAGQVLLTKSINHTGGSATETLSFTRDIARGMYIMEVENPDNTKTNISFINQ